VESLSVGGIEERSGQRDLVRQALGVTEGLAEAR
jgi:hypothetical protein